MSIYAINDTVVYTDDTGNKKTAEVVVLAGQVLGLTPVKTLLAPGACYALTTGASNTNQVLTAGIKAVSIYARTSDAYFALGNGAQTASATKIFIAAGERLELDVTGYASPNIAGIFGPSGAAATLHILELS